MFQEFTKFKNNLKLLEIANKTEIFRETSKNFSVKFENYRKEAFL